MATRLLPANPDVRYVIAVDGEIVGAIHAATPMEATSRAIFILRLKDGQTVAAWREESR